MSLPIIGWREVLKTLEDTYKETVKNFVDTYELDPHLKIVWNSDLSKYEAVKID